MNLKKISGVAALVLAVELVAIFVGSVISDLTETEIPLRSQAAVTNRLVGAAVDHKLLVSDAKYASVLAREFSLVVPEYEFMMSTIHKAPAVYDFVPADTIVDFAIAHNMQAHAHPLIWNPYTPAWVSQYDVDKVAHDHIRTVMSHYTGRVFEWIVVNEAFKSDGTKNWSVWDKECNKPFAVCSTQSTTYIEKAFRYAREADPNARLVYNDINAEELNPKSDRIYQMIKDFRQRGIRVDAVGFQMHVGLSGLNYASVEANFDRFAKLGVSIEITELDVAIPKGTWFGQRRQASVYHDVVMTCIHTKSCTEILTWGFTDKASWIPNVSLGQSGQALEFDYDIEPKAAYYAMRKALSVD